MASKWQERNDSTYTRQYGPLLATVSRYWDYRNSEPDRWEGFLSVGEEKVIVTVTEVGVAWFEDSHDKKMLRIMHKRIQNLIRSWTK